MRPIHNRGASRFAIRVYLGVLGFVVSCGVHSAGPASEDPSFNKEHARRRQVTVLHCVPAELPAAFTAEQAQSLQRTGPRFIETRDTVLASLGLMLGTGDWTGARSLPSRVGARAGTVQECQALWQGPIFGEGGKRSIAVRSLAGQAVAAILDYDYVPTVPSRVRVRVLGLLLLPDGTVEAAASASAQTEYAQVTSALGYQERSSPEVAQALAEQVMRTLANLH